MFNESARALDGFVLEVPMSMCHCTPDGQKNLPLLQRQAFMAISYLEYQIISKPWARKPPLLDEVTSVGQRESALAILSLY